jgi:hypothetical protein
LPNLPDRSLLEMADGLVDVFIAAKWRRLEVSRAMHEPLVEIGGAELVRAAAASGVRFVADILGRCDELNGRDAEPLAGFLVMACTAMLQSAFMERKAEKDTIRHHMRAMVRGYLKEMGASRGSGSGSLLARKPRRVQFQRCIRMSVRGRAPQSL